MNATSSLLYVDYLSSELFLRISAFLFYVSLSLGLSLRVVYTYKEVAPGGRQRIGQLSEGVEDAEPCHSLPQKDFFSSGYVSLECTYAHKRGR